MALLEKIFTFHLDGLFLGIDVSEVHEVLPTQALTPVPLAHPIVAGLINMRGQIVVAIDLRRFLRRPARSVDQRLPINVIVRNGSNLMSLLVDDMGDVIEVDSALFTKPPDTTATETRSLFRGAFQLPSQLLLVFDTIRAIEAIVSQATSKVLQSVHESNPHSDRR
ncbi:MAG: chemotaxis protein CheW [Schlesneria sp.]